MGKADRLNKSSKVLLYASFFGHFAFGLLAPIYAIYVKNIGGSILDIGIAYAIFSIITGLFILFFSRTLFFQKNVRKMIIIGYFLMAICYFIYIFIGNPIQLFIVQIILGVGVGILEIAWDSIFSVSLSEEQAIKNWSIWSGSTNIVLGISAIIGSIIIFYFSFTLLFILMTIFSIISALISFKLLGEKK